MNRAPVVRIFHVRLWFRCWQVNRHDKLRGLTGNLNELDRCCGRLRVLRTTCSCTRHVDPMTAMVLLLAVLGVCVPGRRCRRFGNQGNCRIDLFLASRRLCFLRRRCARHTARREASNWAGSPVSSAALCGSSGGSLALVADGVGRAAADNAVPATAAATAATVRLGAPAWIAAWTAAATNAAPSAAWGFI